MPLSPAPPTGAYNPDTGRKISRLPAYMEIIRESERRKLLASNRTLMDRYGSYAKRCTRWLQDSVTVQMGWRRAGGGSGSAGQQGGDADNAGEPDGPTPEELAEEGRRLCGDYIRHRLLRSGVLTQKLADSIAASGFGVAAAPDSAGPISQELRLVGEHLESMYPDLYKNVHKQLNITMHSEEVVRRTFSMFAEQLCSGGIHWGKVVALFAMAGAFAVDCVQQGHQEYVVRIVDCFGTFVATRLTDWLKKQGGWVLPEVTRDAKRETDRTWFWLMLSLGALVLFVSTLLISASL